jgi:hypothetical protein
MTKHCFHARQPNRAALIAEPDVIACGDGLLGDDGPSQTYHFADGND